MCFGYAENTGEKSLQCSRPSGSKQRMELQIMVRQKDVFYGRVRSLMMFWCFLMFDYQFICCLNQFIYEWHLASWGNTLTFKRRTKESELVGSNTIHNDEQIDTQTLDDFVMDLFISFLGFELEPYFFCHRIWDDKANSNFTVSKFKCLRNHQPGIGFEITFHNMSPNWWWRMQRSKLSSM